MLAAWATLTAQLSAALQEPLQSLQAGAPRALPWGSPEEPGGQLTTGGAPRRRGHQRGTEGQAVPLPRAQSFSSVPQRPPQPGKQSDSRPKEPPASHLRALPARGVAHRASAQQPGQGTYQRWAPPQQAGRKGRTVPCSFFLRIEVPSANRIIRESESMATVLALLLGATSAHKPHPCP